MNYTIKFFAPIIFLSTLARNVTAQENMVTILYGPSERMEATWVTSILTKKGIPLDFISKQLIYTNCNGGHKVKDSLLALCINNKKTLEVIKFDRNEFFWQLKPLLEQ